MSAEQYGKYGMWAGAGGDILGGLGSLFGSQNPADAANQYYNKIPGMLPGYYQPYINAGMNATQPYMQGGQWASGTLQQQLGGLLNDPAGMMNKFGSTFQQSPGYQFQTSQALGAANRAAAAGGMAGSPMEQQNIAGVTNQLANQDYYNYLNHVMGMYGQGLNGLQGMYNTGAQVGMNMYDTGANMSNELAQNMANAYMNQGNLAYAGAINQNQTQGGGWGALGAGLLGAAAAFA